MEYHEAANFLFDLRRYSPTTGVESTRRLLEYLGRPSEELRVVQVVGSNGKGSTARTVTGALREARLIVSYQRVNSWACQWDSRVSRSRPESPTPPTF